MDHDGEPELHGDEIQGNVLPGFNTAYQRLIGWRMSSPRRARDWLADEQTRVATLATVRDARRRARLERDRPVPGGPWLNLCFSYDGLELLGAPDLAEFQDPWFQSGLWTVAASLGDGPTDAWRHGGSRETTPHVLAIVADNATAPLEAECARLREAARRHGLRECLDERGTRARDKREAFGFRDGISVPAVRGRVGGELLAARLPAHDPRSARLTARGQLLLWPGQAVFGYHGQSRTDPVAKGDKVQAQPGWTHDGSFLVLRRLRQHVDVFADFVATTAAELSAETGRRYTSDHVRALLVGRWPNGTPLLRHPTAPGTPDAVADNDFRYMTPTPERTVDGTVVPGAPADLDGQVCPHFAHIRKANPRDAPTDLVGEAMALILQPFRRGIPLDETRDGRREHGLLFLAYGTAIRDGFGLLSRGWLNRFDAPEPGRHGSDPVAGAGGHRRFTFRVDGARVDVVARRPWVEPTGGGFFFAPSRQALAAMATSWKPRRTEGRLRAAAR